MADSGEEDNEIKIYTTKFNRRIRIILPLFYLFMSLFFYELYVRLNNTTDIFIEILLILIIILLIIWVIFITCFAFIQPLILNKNGIIPTRPILVYRFFNNMLEFGKIVNIELIDHNERGVVFLIFLSNGRKIHQEIDNIKDFKKILDYYSKYKEGK